MNEMVADEEVRQSFADQSILFSGSDSPFVRRSSTPTGWVEPLESDMLVLDVACGTANAAEEIAPRVRQVVGIEFRPERLRLGADRLKAAAIDNVLLQNGDVNELPFLDESFDLVVCRNALHHASNPATMVREMARVCRSGGRVAANDVVIPGQDVRVMYDEVNRHIDPTHIGAVLREELVELLANEVGPLSFGQLNPRRLPLDSILSDVSDREWLTTSLTAEIGGANPSGLSPETDAETGELTILFTVAIVHAIKT